MTSPTPPLPTFLIIGAQKSATRWLRSNLGKHPDIFTPASEPSFFNSRYRQGLDYYLAQFDGWAGEPIVGEATPGYMMWRHKPSRVARRIHETLPDVRLIAVLRDPIERANSAMWHHKRRGRLRNRSKLTDVVKRKKPTDDKMCIVTGGWYATSLEKYVELFGDQLLVFLHDDISDDPLWVYRTALEHIGASPDFVPDDLQQVVFSNQQPEKTKRDTKISPADRRKLWPYFAEEVERLERMIGRDLSAWDPTGGRFQWPAVPDDFVDYHDRALGWVDGVVGRVTPSDYDLPTPCPEWNVGDLLRHMIQLSSFNLTVFTDVAVTATSGDLGETYLRVNEKLQHAVATADGSHWRRAVRVPIGMLTAQAQLMLNLKNQIAHAWDLAVATGQDATIPDEVATPIEVFARELFASAPSLRTGFAEPVAAGDAATAGERFVAVVGRDPELATRVRL
jgi:uncharacterized protein (TIGR03086 family)